ncbi:MAG TPA: hypothetical protein VN224_05225 [Xanthomonadales bacterium]|nr:hypothetical protein [Xanthomonadales bacterium]
MFIRFVTGQIDRSSGRRRGVFQAAYALQRFGDLAEYEKARLAETLRWFNVHLRTPSRLTRSRRPHREAQALCWFETAAAQHLARVREMQNILDANGVMVDMVTSRRPGYIVYEDAHQVAAYPFDETQA